MRFTIYDSRYYYRLGEKYTATELAKIKKSVANREKSYGNETCFESKVRLQDVFSQQMVGSHSSAFTSEMFRLCIRTFVEHSLSNRTETKEDWQQLANEMTNDDCWKEIMFTLRSFLQLYHLPSSFAVVVTETTWRPGCPPETLSRTDGKSKTARLKGKEMAAGEADS